MESSGEPNFACCMEELQGEGLFRSKVEICQPAPRMHSRASKLSFEDAMSSSGQSINCRSSRILLPATVRTGQSRATLQTLLSGASSGMASRRHKIYATASRHPP